MKPLATLYCLLISVTLSGQNFLNSYGSINNDEALTIAMDGEGRVYTSGYFNNSANFQGTTIQSNGLSDIFVAKTTEIGTPLWVFSGGSSGPDRGYDIAVAPNGSTCITGYLSNNAQFGGATYATNSFSQDFFVLKLTPSGEVDWVRIFGGELGDTGYGVDIDLNGNIVVTGQFRGTIDFDGTQFTSTPLDDGGLSFDTFVLKLDAAGNVLWAKHGQSRYESRGMDVKTDSFGNVMVCGQFSDTLTFDQTHNNDVFNAAFLVQFDPNGNEQWFKRFTSSQTIAYALATNSNNDIYVTGDNIGPLYFFENEDNQSYYPVDYTYNLFLAKFNTGGDLQWLTNNGSENSVSSKAIALDSQENPYLTGTFKCRFNEYSEEYGTGIFYSAGWRDVFISKFNSTEGLRQWSRHMASNRDDYCSAIVLKGADMPIIAGSFENNFVVTNANTFVNIAENETDYWNSMYCDDFSYGNIRYVESLGNKDIFITAPINLNREPLDYFHRPGNSCDRPYRPPCVNQCADSLVHCGSTTVNFSDFIDNIIHPEYDFQWESSNLGTLVNLQVPETGNYYWTYERLDGCETFADTLHATINPKPLPLISDNVVINTESVPNALPIEFCYPDSVLLMGSNFDENDDYWWSSNTPFGLTDSDSAIYVNQTGQYVFHITNEFGCNLTNEIEVDVFEPLDSISATIIFPNYPEPVDTIALCVMEYFAVELISTDSAQVDLASILDNAEVEWSISPQLANIVGESTPEDISVNVYQSGHYTITVEIQGICNDTTYIFERSVYVLEYPNPYINIWIEGDAEICPGDTTLLVAQGFHDYEWSGPNHITLSNDSILAWQTGNYSISADTTSQYGCNDDDSYTVNVHYRDAPLVAMYPSNGIVCPGDSVLLVTEAGLNHIWVGPQGQIIGSEMSVWVGIPGFYHCVVTDYDGCVIESNFVEVKEYSSPYLVMLPGNDLCFSGSIDITAITDPSAVVVWEAPLNTTSTTVTVSEPGVYTASVTLCGITTTQSVTVYETQVNASINIIDPPTVCNGDSIFLDGNSGMFEYEWLPNGENTEDIWVTEPGEYTLTTRDEQGCEGVSQTVTIAGQPDVNLAELEYNALCSPDSILLSLQDNFADYLWSPTGDTTSSIWITEPGSYQVEVTDANGCTALSDSQDIVPGTAPDTPVIPDEIHCAGDDLIISASVNGDLVWEFPDGEQSANPLIIENLLTDTTLTYFVIGENGCHSESDSLFVQVIDTNYQPQIFGDTILCAGDTLNLFTNEIQNSTYSWSINNEIASLNSELTYAFTDNSGSFTIQLTVNLADCATGVVTETIEVLPLPPLLEITGSTHICEGDSGLLFTQSPDTVEVTWTWYDDAFTGDSLFIHNPPLDSALVTMVSAWEICKNDPQSLWIYFEPNPAITAVSSNSPVCAEETLTMTVEATTGAEITIGSPWGFNFYSGEMALFPADTIYTGEYWIEAATEYCSTSTTQWLEVYPLPAFTLEADSSYCTGSPAVFEIANYDLVFWQDTILSNTYSIQFDGQVKVEVINEWGCAKKDSVYVSFNDCDGIFNNVFTPNNDGVNDYFNFNPYGFEQLHVIIYNRWGKVVCELIDIDLWDGTNCKTGQPVSHGTYFYVVEYVTSEYKNNSKSGYLQIFR